MFRATKDVTETRASEPKPDKITQDRRSAIVGAAALSGRFVAIDVGSFVDSAALRIATTAQMLTKTTNAADQSLACVVVESFGSRRKGYVKSPARDAAFDSANRRYGVVLNRKYHACNSGLVVASRKYGSPTVLDRSRRMRRAGSPSPLFHAGDAITGRLRRLKASKLTWMKACCPMVAHRVSACAYT
jgi:hypothetical protein